MNNLPVEPMSYKKSLHSEEAELLAKCRIIRYRLKNGRKEKDIARAFKMSRNSVGNIIRAFKEKLSSDIKVRILEESLDATDIKDLLSPLKNKERIPKTNKRRASLEQEKIVLGLFRKKKMSYGYKRFFSTIQNIMRSKSPPDLLPLKGITFSQIKGIYKRNSLKVKKVRTKNKSNRPLYQYSSLFCFECLHADTKEVLDQKALPEEIYQKFKLNPELPIFEWNVIDAKSRVRFIAYSHERNSTFGFHFLLFVVSFLRTQKLVNPEVEIKLGMDNGFEFCRGSEKKEAEWNSYFALLGTQVYSYNPHFDVRKNLIERSHLSDDQEFFVPRCFAMNDEISFLKEASKYSYYWNSERPHSGIGMNGDTPLNKLEKEGILYPERILLFPTLLLDKHISKIRETTDLIRFERDFSYLNSLDSSCQKNLYDLKYRFRSCKNAQNVLTQYLLLKIKFD